MNNTEKKENIQARADEDKKTVDKRIPFNANTVDTPAVDVPNCIHTQDRSEVG